MKKLQTALVLALTAAALVVASAPVEARWNSFARGGLRGHGYYAYTPWPYYGGYVAMPSDAQPVVNVAVPPAIIVQPPRALTCQRSREVVTVPTEEGGTRAITITRC